MLTITPPTTIQPTPPVQWPGASCINIDPATRRVNCRWRGAKLYRGRVAEQSRRVVVQWLYVAPMLNVAGNNIHINVFQINGTMMITPIMSAKIIVRPQYRSTLQRLPWTMVNEWMTTEYQCSRSWQTTMGPASQPARPGYVQRPSHQTTAI